MTTNAKRLDNLNPFTDKYKLGTLAQDLITQYDVLRTNVATLIAEHNLLRADVAKIFAINQLILVAPTLAITATSGLKVPKSTTAFTVLIGTTVVTKPVDTDMSALVGVVAISKTALWAFYISAAGTITTSAKTADAVDAAAALALKHVVPANLVELGYITVTNASATLAFTGGTDALNKTDCTTVYHSNEAVTALGAMTAAETVTLTAAAVTALD
jgi:hypothetical protein